MKIETEITTRKIYIANDGRKFENENECIGYECELRRKRSFDDLKAEVGTIECVGDGAALYGVDYIDTDRYEYLWYRPKTREEIIALYSLFNLCIESNDIGNNVGEWIGVEIDGDFEMYTGNEDVFALNSIEFTKEKIIKFYEKLGYNVKIEKSKSAVETRDDALKTLWKQFEDVPMNPKTECIDEPYLHFPAGTHRETIWKWFDEQYSKGVAALLYP